MNKGLTQEDRDAVIRFIDEVIIPNEGDKKVHVSFSVEPYWRNKKKLRVAWQQRDKTQIYTKLASEIGFPKMLEEDIQCYVVDIYKGANIMHRFLLAEERVETFKNMQAIFDD